MSKGSGRRPQKVDDNKMSDNWDRIFGSKKTEDKKDDKKKKSSKSKT